MDRQPFDDIRALIADLKPADALAGAASLDRLHRIVSPGALGGLEAFVSWIADWRGTPSVNRPVIALYAGAQAGPDGVAKVRAQMEAIAAGGAPVSRAAQHLGAGLDVFDLAVDRQLGDWRAAAAMSERECAATMAFGMEALAKQPDLLVLGALGPEAERSAAALAAGLSGEAPAGELAAAVARARREAGDDPLQLLRQLGGRESAAICGAIVAAASQRTPVLLDDVPALAAAEVLHAVEPGAIAHCRIGWLGAAPAHRALAERLGLTLPPDLGLALADGTGSTATLSLIKLACALPLEAST
ncbi:MAG TPA: nicotinate-nucleotide--dimethylbenzimidazole phosphoribosyltransferase [Caulobacteraceae bacterium]|jgi:nicotinate-nucleotide--dimethylbenzimidazole phosphoribosyltransferase|nr:nicotinate-nucleotide--dimethylbenzimidazole phosphoribosyltransferase [Caulobacteraceae bacterium]